MAILCHSAASSFARCGAVVDARNCGQILAKRFNQLNPMYMRRIMGNLCHRCYVVPFAAFYRVLLASSGCALGNVFML